MTNSKNSATDPILERQPLVGTIDEMDMDSEAESK